MTLRFRCVGSYLGLGPFSVLVPVTLTGIFHVSTHHASVRGTSALRRGADASELARSCLGHPCSRFLHGRSVVTDTLSAERVLTPKALKGKLKRTRPRGYTEAPAGARGAKHCTVWMGVACAHPSQSRNLLATICLDPQLVYGAACAALGTVRSARRPRRGRWRGQLAERLAQETLGRREALVRVVGKEEVVMGREGRLSGDARALKVIEPRSVLL